jgi:predicted TPR repeat methyltransferase
MFKESYPHMKFPLWVPRPAYETLGIYAEWSATYDADLTAAGYESPRRVAEAIRQFSTPDTTILDFGCGTGLSGQALQAVGFKHVDGVEISPEMLALAKQRDAYNSVWQCALGEITDVKRGQYQVISFNDPTVEDGSYDAILNAEILDKRVKVIFRENGPHLSEINMGSDIIVLKRL